MSDLALISQGHNFIDNFNQISHKDLYTCFLQSFSPQICILYSDQPNAHNLTPHRDPTLIPYYNIMAICNKKNQNLPDSTSNEFPLYFIVSMYLFLGELSVYMTVYRKYIFSGKINDTRLLQVHMSIVMPDQYKIFYNDSDIGYCRNMENFSNIDNKIVQLCSFFCIIGILFVK